MEIWITEKEKLGQESAAGAAQYGFEVPLDGSFNFGLWGVWESDPGAVSLSVNGKVIFEGVPTQEDILHWRCGSVRLPRGRHEITVTAASGPERMLLSENLDVVAQGQALILWDNREITTIFEPRHRKLTEAERQILRRNGFLFQRERDAERCQAPSGVPLGGIGAGKVELTREGFFTAATINNNQDSPIYRMPGSFFAIQVEEERSVGRLLQTKPVDQLLVPVQNIESECVFPEAHLRYRDAALPITLELDAFSPHIPQDVDNSSLPCSFFRFTLSNPGREAVTARLMFSWENLINTGGHMGRNNQNPENPLPLVNHTWNHSFVWSNRASSYQEQAPLAGGTGLRFAAPDDQGNPSSFGEHVIWTPENEVRVVPDRDIVADEEKFSNWFQKGCRGDFQPMGNGVYRAGALIVEKKLAAGQVETVDFVLAWHMPRYIDSSGNDIGVYYATKFKDAQAVIEYAWGRRSELLAQTQMVRERLRDSSIPPWFVDKLLDERFVANTCTVLDAKGRFSVNEAPTGMCGCLGTLDQRACSGGYWTMFFPRLDAVELELFTHCQEGGCPAHDLGKGEFDLTPRGQAWPDLAAAYVIQVHRYFLRTGDRSFLELHWPYLRAAMDWAISLDETGDAIPTLKPGRGTTYDNQQWDGISAFIATMHEAALALAADLADRMNEPSLAEQWRELGVKAAQSRKKYLWMENEGYIRNAYDPRSGKSDDACFIASLAGDWAMLAGGLQTHLEPELLRQAARGIFERCLFPEGMTDQGGSEKPQSAFMQYTMAYYAGAMALLDMDKAAWEFVTLQDSVITRSPSTRYIQTLTYDPHGCAQGLPYYMTAPASWLFLDALSGVVPDVDRGRLQLGCEGLWNGPSRKVPVFTSTSWFNVETNIDKNGTIRLGLTPLRKIAPYAVQTLALVLPDSAKGKKTKATVNGKSMVAEEQTGILELKVSFDPGQDALQIEIKS